MAAVMEKAWTAPAGTRWSFPLFGGRDNSQCAPSLDEALLEQARRMEDDMVYDKTPEAIRRVFNEETSEAILDAIEGRGLSGPYLTNEELWRDCLGDDWRKYL